MKKNYKSLIFIVLTVFFVSILAAKASAFAGGDGSSENPYQITDCAQLQEMNNDLTANYILVNDIDCSVASGWNSEEGFVPIGTFSSFFTGTFDGQEHKITGLFINRPSTDYIGLFGRSDNTIKNVGLVDVNIIGNNYVGGLVGFYGGGTITNSYATGNVTGDTSVGGLVGENHGAITNSYATGSVTGNICVGGLVGSNGGGGTITNSYATGNVTGTGALGGLLGFNIYGTITNSYATGSVTGGYQVGGLVGENLAGVITNSYATGSVTGSLYEGYEGWVGGLVGFNFYGTITNSYATGSVTGGTFVGGLVGYKDGTIENSYATGSVTGYAYVGGLVGVNYGAITNSYATGSVTGYPYVGGLVGENPDDLSGTITNSYWDTETSGQLTSDGGTGKTTAEMKQQSTYETWDFVNIWAINPSKNNGYPYFLWQITEVITNISDVGPATFWIGLKNSDDQGTQFDLRTELHIKDSLIAEGETLCITGVTRNPAYAKQVTVPFGPISNGAYDPGDILSMKVLTRIGTTPGGQKCSGPGGSHNNAVGLRLYYDAPNRPSRFGAEIAPDTLKDYFLHSTSSSYFTNDIAPTGTVKYKDSSSINYNNGNPWKEIGTWQMVLE